MADRQRRQCLPADTGNKDFCVSAAVNIPGERRRTPLHVAVINRRIDAVRRLLSVRAVGDGVTAGRMLRRCRSINRSPLVDIDAADADGYSPLHLAVIGDKIRSYADITTLLLQCGADVNRLPTTTSCDGSTVDPTMSTLALACQRRDLHTAELLLEYGACDADLTIMKSAVANDDTEVVGVLLSRQHAYADTKFALNRAAVLAVQGRCVDNVDSSTHSTIPNTSLSSLPAVMIDWRALTLERLVESWLSQAALSYLKMSLASSLPPWLLHDRGRFASYFITRIDVSENHLNSLPSMLFSLPSLRILIAAGNQVSLIIIIIIISASDLFSTMALYKSIYLLTYLLTYLLIIIIITIIIKEYFEVPCS